MKNSPIFFALMTWGLATPVTAQTTGGAEVVVTEAAVMDRQSSANPSQAESRVADDFTDLAGSRDNAGRLVRGLRTGETVSLTENAPNGTTTSTSFKPATGKTGLGNVFISLALAQESLKSAGVSSPTSDQLIAALNGGSVTVDGKTIELKGVLTQRASGAGWGKIAQSLGVKLGPVVSAIKSENARQRVERRNADQGRKSASTGSREGQTGKPGPDGAGERSSRPEKAERPEKLERPEKPAKPERPARP